MKIYIKETPLFLCEKGSDLGIDSNQKGVLLSRYTGKMKHLLNHIDLLEKSSKYKAVIIEYENLDILKNDFQHLFKVITAAGAIVCNELGEYLMIHRLDHWDLPKGKVEKEESIEVAALREIKEETGAKNVVLGESLLTTYHMYKIKKKRILKKTFWFSAKAPKQRLKAQAEESIEQAVWMSYDDLQNKEEPIYKNIQDVINEYRSLAQ